MMKLKQIFNSFLNIFFPPLCVTCSIRLTEKERHICLHCLSKLPRTRFHLASENSLEQLLAGRFHFQQAAAFAFFTKGNSLQRIIHEMKYNSNPSLAFFAGELCGDELHKSSFIKEIDYIIPIPLHPKRIRKRGYNQSDEIAKGISVKTNIPVVSDAVSRVKNTSSQTQSSKFERWKNVENVFLINRPEIFESKHILLIDDVITTGSTIESCAKEILKNTDCKVSIYALATASQVF